MSNFILTNDSLIRFSIFVLIFLCMTILEIVFPRRIQEISRLTRWPNNIGILLINNIALRVFFPVLAVTFALMVTEKNWGVLNQLQLPLWIEFLLAVVLLDLVIYTQHHLFHRIPFLWRVHRVHHSDTEFDVTTGLRFHPFEIVISMIVKMAFIIILGPAASAVLVFEIVLNSAAMFNHSNIYIPKRMDALIRLLIVTPDMHRIHHSIDLKESNCNFGFSLTFWDYLFKTYLVKPSDGHKYMKLGIDQFRSKPQFRIDKILMQPFSVNVLIKERKNYLDK